MRQGPHTVSLKNLFFGFLRIGLFGFGGVAPWARHVIVAERAWLSEAEYAAFIGIGQALPGANTVNAAVMIGDRFQGWRGALVALVALMAMPIVVLVALATLYAGVAGNRDVAAVLTGGGAAAAGLIIGTALKMLRNLALTRVAVGLLAASFVAVGVLKWPLVPVMGALVPVGLVAAALERRA